MPKLEQSDIDFCKKQIESALRNVSAAYANLENLSEERCPSNIDEVLEDDIFPSIEEVNESLKEVLNSLENFDLEAYNEDQEEEEESEDIEESEAIEESPKE